MFNCLPLVMNVESCVMTEWCDEIILVSFLLKKFFLFNIKTVTTEHINIVFKKKITSHRWTFWLKKQGKRSEDDIQAFKEPELKQDDNKAGLWSCGKGNISSSTVHRPSLVSADWGSLPARCLTEISHYSFSTSEEKMISFVTSMDCPVLKNMSQLIKLAITRTRCIRIQVMDWSVIYLL